MNNQHASVNTIISRAGSRRYRVSRTPAASITSSSTGAGNTRAKTPIEIRSGSRSCAAFDSRVTPAMQRNYTHVILKKRHWGVADQLRRLAGTCALAGEETRAKTKD